MRGLPVRSVSRTSTLKVPGATVNRYNLVSSTSSATACTVSVAAAEPNSTTGMSLTLVRVAAMLPVPTWIGLAGARPSPITAT